MKFLLWSTIILFVFKLGWNLVVPYMLGIELIASQSRAERTRGISLMPWLEVLLVPIVGLLSSQTAGDGWIYGNGAKVVATGIGAIILSALHFILVGALFGAAAARRAQRRQRGENR
jgi:hypothetical protein